MKTMKKAFALVLTLAIVMSLGITAFADPTGEGEVVPAAADLDYKLTITNDTDTTGISIKGKEFVAYKLFDVSYKDMPGTTPDAGVNQPHTYTVAPAFDGFEYDHDGDASTAKLKGQKLIEYVGSAEVRKSQDLLHKFARAAYNHIKDNTAAAKTSGKGYQTNPTVDATLEAAVFDLKVTGEGTYDGPGYYLVYAKPADDLTSALILDTTNPQATVAIKVKTVTLDKKINLDDGTSVEQAPFEAGKTVNFTLETTIPTGLEGYDRYEMKFTDEMGEAGGLDICDKSGFTVKFVRPNAPNQDIVMEADVKADTSENVEAATEGCMLYIDNTTNGFTLRLPDLTKKVKDKDNGTDTEITPAAGDKIVVTYSAKLDANAINFSKMENTATLTYFNDPLMSSDKDEAGKPLTPSSKDTPNEKTTVYNFGIDVDKYKLDGSNPDDTSKKLAGVGFKLFKNSSASATDGIPAGKSYYVYSNNAVTWTTTASNATERVTQNTGKLDQAFVGLVPGTYYLEESNTPDGYNGLEAPVRITITELKDSNGDVTGAKYVVAKYNGTKYVDETFADGTNTNAEQNRAAAQDMTFSDKAVVKRTIPVANSFGKELPSTGGVGTTIFYVGGAMLMVSALVLLITKKKMSVN